MPPRTPSVSVAISALARPFGAASPAAATGTSRCLVAAAAAATSSGVWHQPGLKPSATTTTAGFSTTANRQGLSRLRRRFIDFLNKRGSRYRRHIPGQTNYVETPRTVENIAENQTDKPFPINPLFVSMPVLDDAAREVIWRKIMKEGESIKAVSALYGVDIRRVAAIVRLKEVEKDWEAKGQKLAKPYAKALLEMLPTRTIKEDIQSRPFEPINELHVHPYTMQQLFWPTSESRRFTREDAAKAFHETMLSADKRVPHPELIQMEREIASGLAPFDASGRFKRAVMESERRAAEESARKAALKEKNTIRVSSKRFEFRFEKYNSELVGPKGKARSAVGWRYGAPYYDRAKGEIKIPTSVP